MVVVNHWRRLRVGCGRAGTLLRGASDAYGYDDVVTVAEESGTSAAGAISDRVSDSQRRLSFIARRQHHLPLSVVVRHRSADAVRIHRPRRPRFTHGTGNKLAFGQRILLIVIVRWKMPRPNRTVCLSERHRSRNKARRTIDKRPTSHCSP